MRVSRSRPIRRPQVRLYERHEAANVRYYLALISPSFPVQPLLRTTYFPDAGLL